jgi:alpha-L-rhamnosidase
MTQHLPTHLRVEHLDDALGTDVRRPRLSWWLPAGSRSQIAYQLRTGHWDSGRIESDQSVLVDYSGPQLQSRQQVACAVKVWTDAGESGWSEPVHWEMGLLESADWVAEWIEPPEADNPGPAGRRPPWLLRRSFTVDDAVVLARLYATAHGIYELFLNGVRVGSAELTPGCTAYAKHVHVQTNDVTDLLQPGVNVIGAVVSDGWFRGQMGAFRHFNQFGDRLALLAQLEVMSRSGRKGVVTSDAEWTAATGAMRGADLMQGVVIDFRHDREGWCTASYHADDAWRPVRVVSHDTARLRASPSPPVRRIEERSPVTVRALGTARQVVDFGQNLAGWIRLGDLGPAGTQLRLTYGEALAANGDVTTDNIDSSANAEELGLPDAAKMPEEVGPLQVDDVISAGIPGQCFEPRHSTKGFRYVRVEGHSRSLSAGDVKAIVVHTDLRRTGWFACSDDRINRLHEAAVWTLRGNAVDIPTDCPHRERSGWTSEWLNSVRSAAFLFDVAGFSTKWLRDLAADQQADGTTFLIAPEGSFGKSEVVVPGGSAGYSDAAVFVPWRVYRAYGDLRLLSEQWPSMTGWVDRCARIAATTRHPDRVKARPHPEPHEQYLLDTGVHFGEWLAPPSPVDQWNPKLAKGRDDGDLATAFMGYSATLLARMAEALGKDEDAARYGELAEAIRSAWWTEYGNADGAITPATQANHVRALAFGLAPGDLRDAVATRLVGLIHEADTHVGTGTFGTASLLPVLADAGRADVAYQLLLRDTPPSWMTMLDRGATTIWESWDGVDEHGNASFSLNHFSLGSVISFLHTHTAGIRLLDAAPAYRHFRIEPVPGGGLTWATGRLDSPYGRIESAWQIADGRRFQLDVVVPPGTTADVRLPDGQHVETGPGRRRFECRL